MASMSSRLGSARDDAQVGQPGGVGRGCFDVRSGIDENQVDAVGAAGFDGTGQVGRIGGEHHRRFGVSALGPLRRAGLGVGVDHDDASRTGALGFDGIVEGESRFADAALLGEQADDVHIIT